MQNCGPTRTGDWGMVRSMKLLRSILRRLRLLTWRHARVGEGALVQPLMVRLDPGAPHLR